MSGIRLRSWSLPLMSGNVHDPFWSFYLTQISINNSSHPKPNRASTRSSLLWKAFIRPGPPVLIRRSMPRFPTPSMRRVTRSQSIMIKLVTATPMSSRFVCLVSFNCMHLALHNWFFNVSSPKSSWEGFSLQEALVNITDEESAKYDGRYCKLYISVYKCSNLYWLVV